MTTKELKFNALYRDYEKLPFAVLGQLNVPKGDREDISQEVWCRVWRHINHIDHSLKVSSWIYTITKHAAFDLYRKHRIEKSRTSSINYQISEEDELADVIKIEELPEDDLDSIDQFEVLIEEIDELLPERNRVFLKALILSGLSYNELFEAFGDDCNAMGTLKVNIARGRTLLKKRGTVYRELKGVELN